MSYSGPGDIVSGALGWWGLRAYSSAKAATAPYAAIRVDDGIGNGQDINILASGDLDVAALQTFITTFGQAFLFRLYDQISNRNMEGSVVFPLVISPTGLASGRVAIRDASAGNFFFNGGTVTMTTAQPFTISTFYNSTKSASEGWLFSNAANNVILFNDRGGAANLVGIRAGADLNATAAENAWHGVQGVFNGASSGVNVDGIPNAGSAGANVFSAENCVLFNAAGLQWRGDCVELGIWSSKGFNDTESANIYTNQNNYWVVGTPAVSTPPIGAASM